jgi:hypothetical protein
VSFSARYFDGSLQVTLGTGAPLECAGDVSERSGVLDASLVGLMLLKATGEFFGLGADFLGCSRH